VNIGELKHRVTIQKKAEKKPLEDTTYTDFKTVWAKVSNLYGKEFIEAQKVEANISKKLIIRYIKDLDMSLNPNACKDFIITYKGISYNILYIDNIKEQNKFMEIMVGIL
jgi:SPP1 family predicted phage head-tail adaptor